MTEIPEDDLDETRAALAPTLDATAAILPWVATPKPLRFAPELNQRWVDAGKHLAQVWSERHTGHGEALRPAVFGLYTIALETGDMDSLRLGEALASAADRLEAGEAPAKLIAALSATIECLSDPAGLEHAVFGERAAHFADRLDASLQASLAPERSPVLDHLFVEEANEHLELMRDALAMLPPDAYALATEASWLAQQAELIELWGIMHLARQFAEHVNREAANLDVVETRDWLETHLEKIAQAVEAIER